MSRRTLGFLLVPLLFSAGVALYFYLNPPPKPKPARTRVEELVRQIPVPPPPVINVPPPELPLAKMEPLRLPPPAREQIVPTKLIIPIQDGATIDYSPGAPLLRQDGPDKAAIERAMREMNEATKDITFTPRPAQEPRRN